MKATVKYRMVTLMSAPGEKPVRKHYSAGEYATLEYAVASMFRQNALGTFLWTLEPVVTEVTP